MDAEDTSIAAKERFYSTIIMMGEPEKDVKSVESNIVIAPYKELFSNIKAIHTKMVEAAEKQNRRRTTTTKKKKTKKGKKTVKEIVGVDEPSAQTAQDDKEEEDTLEDGVSQSSKPKRGKKGKKGKKKKSSKAADKEVEEA